MNKIVFVVDVCCNNITASINQDIADNLQAFASIGIDVQFLCLPSQYQHIKQELSETVASNVFVSVVYNPTVPAPSEIATTLRKVKRSHHTHAFYCDLQTIVDDDVIKLLTSDFATKLLDYAGDKIINFDGIGAFFGGRADSLSSGAYTKKYSPKDKTKNNVKNLLKKIKTGK